MLSGAITSLHVKNIFEAWAEKVIKGAAELLEADGVEAMRRQAWELAQAEAEKVRRLEEQAAKLHAEFEKQEQADATQASAREADLREKIDSGLKELGKLQKAKGKVDKTLEKTQSTLKIAQLKAEKDAERITQLEKDVRAKSETMMAGLFAQLKLDFQAGQTPGELLRTLVASHEASQKELQKELNGAHRTIEEMRQDIAEGNKGVLEERDRMVKERDNMAVSLAAAVKARNEADEEAERLRKEAIHVRATAKQAVQAEVDQLKEDVAARVQSQAELQERHDQTVARLEGVKAELGQSQNALRLARAAGQNGGYYFAAVPVAPKTGSQLKTTRTKARTARAMTSARTTTKDKAAVASGSPPSPHNSDGGKTIASPSSSVAQSPVPMAASTPSSLPPRARFSPPSKVESSKTTPQSKMRTKTKARKVKTQR